MPQPVGRNPIPEQTESSSFGEWLRRLRKLRDLTQDELAQQVGCARISIRKFESDQMRPSKQLAELLAQALSIPAGERAAFVQYARGAQAGEESAPPVTNARLTNNLPLQPTSFVGREHEMVEVKRLLATAQLLTLTGSGGTGKTRLALQIGAELLDHFKDGVWFVELAAVSDAALVADTIASVLGVREEAARPLIATLLESLRPRELLLILDNCEHLIEACAKFADAVLHSSRKVRILATSREALGISGESAWSVPSLPAPNPAEAHTLVVVEKYTAVQLFIERARQSLATFRVTNANAPAVAQICYRLDGIPLAIELAAARVKAMRVEQIAERLDDRFRLLTGGSRTALPRQQTLRSLVDWSHSLLSEPERVLLRRLSVFAGGWTLEAAEEVCADYGGRRPVDGGKATEPPSTIYGLRAFEVLEELTHLVEKSLVVLDEQAIEPRYRMLETIRQYAREKLLEADESAQMRARHLSAFAQFAETAEPNLSGPAQVEWLNRVESEHDNLRAALAWALAQGESATATRSDVFVGVRLSGALYRFWWVRGYWGEGRQWLQQALALIRRAAELAAMPSDYRGWQARVLNAAGSLASSQADYAAARALLEESLTLSRALGDKQGTAATLLNLGHVARTQGDFAAARALLEESLMLRRALGDKEGIAYALLALGVAAFYQGDNAASQPLLEESLALSRELGNKQGIASSLFNLGGLAASQGDPAAAQTLLEESLTLSRELGSLQDISLALIALGSVAGDQGDYMAARALLGEGLALIRNSGYSLTIAWCLLETAVVAQSEGQLLRAARMLGAHEALLERIGAVSVPSTRAAFERTGAAVHSQLGTTAFSAAWEAGRQMTLDEAIALAITKDP